MQDQKYWAYDYQPDTRLFPRVIGLDRMKEFPSIGAFFHDVLAYGSSLMESRVSWLKLMRGCVFKRMLRHPCNSLVLVVIIHFSPLCSTEDFRRTALRLVEEMVSLRPDAVSLSAYRVGVDEMTLVVFPDIRDAYMRMCLGVASGQEQN